MGFRPSHTSVVAPRRTRVSPTAEALEERRLFAVPAGFVQEAVGGTLNNGTSMAVAPDGRIFVTTQGGTVRVVKGGTVLSTPFLTVDVNSAGERGLLGFAFDPDFAANRFVYVYYTATSPTIHNRVSRFTADGDVAVPGSETVLLDQAALGDATNHNGGAMHFGADGKLYIGVGENAVPNKAQNLTTTFGKILRINRDGSIPADNPFVDVTDGINESIYARGFRNPFTFAVQPGTGKVYVNDVGHVGEGAWEEISRLLPGKNYGWPAVEGYLDASETAPADYQDPLYAYVHGPGQVNGKAITGGAFYNPAAAAANRFPASYTGDYFFGDLSAGWIKRLDADGVTVAGFATGVSAGVDIDLAPDGSLLYLQRGNGGTRPGGVFRIRYTQAPVAPPSITDHPDPVTVMPGEPATFSVGASGTGTLGYQWLRDGAEIPGATGSSYTLALPQPADDGAAFRVRVSNAGGPTLSNPATLTVTTNAAPVPVIDLPAADTRFVAGQTVSFSGSASDPEDGALANSALTWSVQYVTGGVVRPFVAPFSGQPGGTFTPATVTPYLGTDVSYRIVLTATDSLGRSRTVTRDVLPTVVDVTLAASTPGLKVNLDGNPKTTPNTAGSVAGLTRELSAPLSQVLGGVTYDFVSWSDGGSATHDVSIPTSDVTYTATYKARATTVRNGLTGRYFDNANFNGASYTRVDANINFASTSGRFHPSVGPDTFSVRWTGQVKPAKTERYTFYTSADDAARLWVNGVLIIDRWTGTPNTTYSGSINLTAGKVVAIKLEYRENTGNAKMKLEWSGPTTPRAVVPTSALFATTAAAAVTSLSPVADAYVRQDQPTAKFGTAGVINARRSSSAYAHVGYLTFDLSSVGTINSAVLKLFGGQTISGPTVDVTAYKVSDTSWIESSVDYVSRPTLGGSIFNQGVTGTTAKWYAWDLTDYFKAEKEAGQNRVSIGLIGLSPTTPIAQFNSREASANRPVLEVS